MTEFSLKNPGLLRVDLNNNKVLARAGAMVAYDGKVKFSKAILGGEGLFGALKRRITNEVTALMTCEGQGAVYFAHEALEVSIIKLEGEKLFVESNSLLAYEPTLDTNVAFAGLHGAASGQGLFTTTLSGKGHIAIISHGGTLQLQVTPNMPLFIDPDAFIAFQGNIEREFILDVNWKTMVGQTSGETYQIKFTGNGVVYIQPSERTALSEKAPG